MGKLKDLKYYQNYHKHTSLSHRYNKDSPLVVKDYFKYYAKNSMQGYPQIYSTVEHGWQGNYFKIYDDLEHFNSDNHKTQITNKDGVLEDNKYYSENYKDIKFIFGTEAYWVKDRTSTDNSNCHIVLLAKNDNGRKKLNRAIYESYKTGYYYKNRMDLELLLSLPKDDIFVTTACVGFWTSYMLPFKSDEQYEEIDEVILKLNDHFTDFYLEAQANNTDLQKQINKHILYLHNKYNIPMISATDSHILNETNIEDRDDLLRSNGINYPEEEGAYIDCPSVELLIQRFQEQEIYNDYEIYELINNTNKILDFEDIVLDRSLKVPVAKKYKHLTQEERNKVFRDILTKEWKLQIDDINRDKYDQYISEVKSGIAEIEGCGMADYFIDNYEIMKLGQEKYGGTLTPSGRGSAVSMYLNKLLRFTKVDKVNSPVLMYAERFLTKERVLDSKTPPDIDHNVSAREPFVQAQKDIICEEGTFDLLALGTLHYKSAFKMYARAYNLDPTLANEVTKQITKYEKDLKYIEDEDEKDLMGIYDYVDKEKYGYLIDGCQQYMGIVDNIKSHPCGALCYDGDAIEDIGVIMVRSESTERECFVALIESATIDSFGYLKQDYLIVASIGLTYAIYKELGMTPMSVNELLKTIDKDEQTWDIYKNGFTMCINQAEQPKSTQKAMLYKPKNISELTQWISGIRPSFKTMYKTFENREHFDYGIKAFDDLIQDEYCNSSFILYQEHLMKVLSFAGFEIGKTYNIIKAISKKKEYVIKQSKEDFIPNFGQAILDTKETTSISEAHKLSEKVWSIVESSADYGFNSSHAYCMAIDSVTLAWQKAHYPLEFYKVALQWYTDKGNKNKVSSLKQEMSKMSISLRPIKFGEDNRNFSIDRENNIINQTMSSIKSMQKIVPDYMYDLGLKEPKTFFDILNHLKNVKVESKKIDKKSLDMLIKLDYFSSFGHIHQLLSQVKVYSDLLVIYDRLKTCKQLNKSDLASYNFTVEEVAECSTKVTEKQFKELDNQALLKLFRKHYKELLAQVSNKYPYKPTTIMDKLKYEVELLGYTDLVDENVNADYYIVLGIEVNQWGKPFIDLYHISTGFRKTVAPTRKKKDGGGITWYNSHAIKVGDILDMAFSFDQDGHYEKQDDDTKKWVNDNTYTEVFTFYSIK